MKTIVTLEFNFELSPKGKEELESLIDAMFNEDLLFDNDGDELNACCPTVIVE